MKLVSRCALICFCCFCYTATLYAAMPYDDFSGSQIDENKWSNSNYTLEFVKEVSGGKFHKKIRVVTPENNVGYSSQTLFLNPNSITELEATVTVDSYSFKNDPTLTGQQRVSAAIYGNYYEDANGTIRAAVGITDLNDGNGLRARGILFRTANDGSGTTEEIDVRYFTGITITLGNPYILSIRYDAAGERFTCRIEDGTTGASEEITIDEPIPSIGPPAWDHKSLLNAYVVDNNTTLAGGSIFATFDNVRVNGNAYDDFSSAPLDASRWQTSEAVNEIRDGKLQLNRQNFGKERKTSELSLLPTQVTDYFQADVTIDSDTVLTGDNTTGEIRVMGTYYNYKYNGSGYNGDDGEIAANVRVRQYSDGRLKSYANIFRCENASCDNSTELLYHEFSCDVQLDMPVTLAIEKKGSTLVFSCDQEQFSHELSGPLYAPGYKMRKLRSRVYSVPGEYGYLKATADNVFIKKSSPWNLFMSAILTATQK